MKSQLLRLPVLAALLTLAFSSLAHAATLNVPSSACPTIQSAINAAQSGDTVLVGDGTYTGNGNRDLDFLGKSLTVKSVNGATKTIIDCGGYASTDGSGNHRGFYIHSGELQATISGFTVKNGYEAYISSIPGSGYGGGVYNYNNGGGTITLTDCAVSGNTAAASASGYDGGYGGGVYNYNNGGGTITLTGCTVSGNTAAASASGYGAGGGVYNYNNGSGGGTITLTGCTVSGNTAAASASGYGAGGGVYNYNNGGGTITLTDCAVSGNTAAASASGYGGYGGGVYNENDGGTITLTGCTVSGNTASSYVGGVYNYNIGSGTITLTGCTVSGNTAAASASGYGAGGGVYNYNYNYNGGGGTITLTGCTVSGNTAAASASGYGGYVGGVYNYNYNYNGGGGTITLTGCTVSGNTAAASASGYGGYVGGVYNYNIGSGTITLTNDIVYRDLGGETVNSGNRIAINYSDIQGGSPITGTGNINADPLFVRNPNPAATPPDFGDLHLQPGSPCLGAGTPNGAPATDLDGNPRPNPPSMGAYELAPAPATITAFTLSPSQISAAGSTVTASVTASGAFSKLTVSPAPGTLGSASPTFTLSNSGSNWTGPIPTAFLKVAKTNPVTFVATGTRSNGSTATATATLVVGALPTLSLAVSIGNSAVPAGQQFGIFGSIRNLSPVTANGVTIAIPLPSRLTFVSSPEFRYNAAQQTITWTGSLAANGGSQAINVEFQASANTPANTQVTINATASAVGFQNVTVPVSVVISAPPVPVGVDIDTSAAEGQATGTAVITSSAGASPLQAVISPVSGLGHAWLGVDYAYGADGHQLPPTSGVSVGSLAASLGVAGPGASPTYAASFPRIGSQCNIGLRLTGASAAMNIGSIVLSALGGILGPQAGDPAEVFAFYNELQKIPALSDAADQLTHPATTLAGKARQAAYIVSDILNLNPNELDELAIYFSGRFGKVITAGPLKAALRVVGAAQAIFQIEQIVQDEVVFSIQTGGGDAVITYTGSATPHPDQRH